MTPQKNKISTVWKTVLDDVQVSVSPSVFNSWIKTLYVARIDDAPALPVIEIHCTSSFHFDLISSRFFTQIKDALSRALEKEVEIKLLVDTSHQEEAAPPALSPLFQQSQPHNGLKIRLHHLGLREDYDFDHFAVSSSNEMAHAAATAVAGSPGHSYNPLFFYGGVGVGKTHLMQAIAIACLSRDVSLKMIYCAGEQFTNEIIEAIQGKNTSAFRQRYRSVKALFIDDIQFIAGKTTVQEEFFHTFNAILQSGGQVVMTSDRPPSEIKALEDRLRSRFEAGLLVDIGEPNFELRTAIILIKAQQRNLHLDMDLAQMVAANMDSARKIEGFLVKLQSAHQIQKKAITPALIKTILHMPSSNDQKPPPLRPAEIIRGVAHYYELNSKDLQGKGRLQRLVKPRHIAMYLLRKDYQLHLEEVGALFSNRDHTTVMHAVTKITNELKDVESMRYDVNQIREHLYRQ